MRLEKQGIYKRLVVGALIVTISGFFVSPRIARAQFADTIGGPTAVANAVKLSFGDAIWAAAAQGLMSSISLFTRQFAYDMAVGLASGAKGQNPLAFLSEPRAYFNSLAQDSVGELIGGLGSGPWSDYGIDLCKPQIPQVALKLQLGLALGAGVVDRPKPKCQWQQIANNWSAIGNQIQNPNLLLQNVSLQFKPGQSDLGAAIALEGALANKVMATKEAGVLKRLEGNGILPKEGLIANNTETPSAVVKAEFEELARTQSGINSQHASTTTAFLNATVGKSVWLSVGSGMLSTFANTLTQKLLQNVVGGLFQLARGSGSGGNGINLNSLYALNPQGLEGTQAAQQAYSNLLVSNIKTGNGMDIATEFATCPQKREEAGLYNCVVDSQFAAALQQSNSGNALTVRDAITQHFLDASKPFGFSDPRADKEPDVTEGYSYSNMKKLRLARVIPVGWEFAAQKTKDVGRKTLGEVMDGFAKEGTVPGCGQSQSVDPSESPFCGLVDPMWVLKVPAAQCAQQAASKMVDTSGARMDACIDLQNCVAEDGNGNCKSWGYCTKEKRSWSVGGDTCPSEYATCQGFQNTRTNAEVSYLRSTLDSTTCNSENAGCRWLSTARNVENANWQVDKRIYLNGKAQTCDATAAGCTEFISNTANLIQNSSFEKNTTVAGVVTAVAGWRLSGTDFVQKYTQDQNAFEGSAAIQASGADFTQAVRLEGALQYTLSAYGKGTNAVVIKIAGAVAPDGNTCVGSMLSFNPGNANQYIRASCTFFTTAAGGEVTLNVGGGAAGFIDAVQLEKGTTATTYHDGYGATKQSVFLKAPPTWLGCTGEEGEPSECRSYARVCRRDEVGCEQYTPVTADPALTGTVTAADRCPEECVGYAAYKQELSAFDGPLYPQYIIPARASVCAGEDIGCAAFTNLQSEKVEYYREVRACELPATGDSSATFVTWEGSENSGYQIKNWLLKQSLATVREDKGTCGTDNRCSNGSNVLCRSNNDCIVNAFGQGQSGATAIPPCTNYELVETSGSLHMVCRDTATNQATCLSGQVGVDPDCRGFYDAAGDIFYRKYSRTVLITDKCTFSRIGGTGTQIDEGACWTRGGSWDAIARKCKVVVNSEALLTNLSDEISCKYGRGTWRSDRQECVYAIFAPESRTCQAASLGCREYSGNAGNNVRTVFEDNFDAGIGEWKSGAGAIVQSSEAVNPGGYAVKVAPSPAGMFHAVTLEQSGTYTVDFWAKGTGSVAARFFGMPEAAPSAIVAISQRPASLSATWQHYSFGPVTATFASSATAQIVFDVSGGTTARMYIDNVVVKKVSQNLSLIAASTKNIPISCDSVSASLGGARSPQYMLGCAEYKDRAGTSQYIKSFSRFCRASSVGCSELSNTQNTTEQFGSTVNTSNAGVCRGLSDTDCYYNAVTDTYKNVPGSGFTKLCHIAVGDTSCTYGQNAATAPNLTIDDVTVPAHALAYLVVDSAGSCKEEQKGCQSLGQQTSSGWNTVYYKNLPDTYGETMCRHEENGCDAWTGGSGAVYFKATTGTNECVWKDNVVIAGNTYNGWFKANAMPIAGISAADPTNQVQMNEAKSLCEGYGKWVSGACLGTNGTPVSGVTSSIICQGAGGHWVQESNVCTKTDMPCYGSVTFSTTTGWSVDPDPKETFLIGGKTFGVWKNIDPLYRGQIASCPVAQVGCTELIDRNDCTDANRKNCTAYYVKDNDKLDKKTCRQDNKVSAKDGCVLFDDTSDPEKQYNTDLSYNSNRLTPSAPSATGATSNNANMLLKVKLDRNCAEWLTCQSAASVFDPSLGRFKLVCNSLGRCNEIVSRPDQGEIGQCANWVDQDTGDQSAQGIARAKNLNARLTRDTYQSRDIHSFTAVDFSGYSIPGYYPLDRLTQVSWTANPVEPKSPDFRLAAVVSCDSTGANCAPFDGSTGVKNSAWPFLGRCTITTEGSNDCGPKDSTGKGIGRCYANKSNNSIKTCIQNPDGSTAKTTIVAQVSCRAYPDRSSPFPNDGKIKTAQAFENSTVCDDTTGVGCECDYKKASYGGLKDFYYAKDAAPEPKLCVGGTASLVPGVSENTGTKIEGQSCIANSECVSGDCRALNKVTNYKGVRGYCLEEDLSRSVYGDESQHPCLTWLPTDSVVGGADIYNQYTAAGFQPQPGNEWYCSAGFTDVDSRTITVNDTNAQTYFSAPHIGGNGNACGASNNCGSSSCKDLFNNGGGWCKYPLATTSWTGGNGPNSGLMQYRCSGFVSQQGVCRVNEDCVTSTGVAGSCAVSNDARSRCTGGTGELVGKYCLLESDCYYQCSSTLTCIGGLKNGQVCSGTFVAGVPQCGTAGTCQAPVSNAGRAQTNFLGEYIISDTGSAEDHIIENDWTGPGPIYRSMIEAIQVGFDGHNDLGGSWVGGTVGGTGKDRGLARCNFQKTTDTGVLGVDKNCFDNQNFVIKVDSGRALMVQPLFDPQGKLISFRIQMSSPGDSDYGSVVVDSIKIALKPGCSEIRKVSEKGAYTDRLWDKGTTVFDDKNLWYNVRDNNSTTQDRKFNPTIRYSPWGAVGPNPNKSPYIVETASQDGGIDYCKSPGSQWCGATYEKEQVKQLFAKFGKRLSWSSSVGVRPDECFMTLADGGLKNLCYTPALADATEDKDRTTDATDGGAKAPSIRPLATCRDDGKCIEGAAAGITIADKSGAQDLVLGYGGLLQTTMRFYAWADKDHMPLKRIVVDWHGAKDGGIPEYDAGYQNYYRNRRGLTPAGQEQCVDAKDAGKSDGQNTARGFGNVLNQSCDNAYFKFQITYTCSGNTSPFWEDATSCPLSEFVSRYGGCCVFKPRAKVVDNWDWCSGNGGQVKTNPAATDCTETKGWVNFAGKVLVAPKFKQN